MDTTFKIYYYPLMNEFIESSHLFLNNQLSMV